MRQHPLLPAKHTQVWFFNSHVDDAEFHNSCNNKKQGILCITPEDSECPPVLCVSKTWQRQRGMDALNCTSSNFKLMLWCTLMSYPAGSDSVVVSAVVPLLLCSVVEVVLGSAGVAGPRASWPGEGLPLLLLAAGDRPDGEGGGGVWRATPARLFSSPFDVSSTLSEGRHRQRRGTWKDEQNSELIHKRQTRNTTWFSPTVSHLWAVNQPRWLKASVILMTYVAFMSGT